MKTAIIIGCEGQDGRIAFDLLTQKKYRILGISRGGVKSVGIDWKQTIDITNKEDVLHVSKAVKADEIYYLAACHQSSQGRSRDESELLKKSHAVNVEGLLNFCEGIKTHNRQARLFYAASSLIYEGTDTALQDEATPFCPKSIYGMTKLNGLLMCRYYKDRYGIFASSGILYNHESVYRGDSFISTRIIKAALNIKESKQDLLVVGDLDAQVDWGYAPDYVLAMHQILNSEDADDFIIASGMTHSVRDFVMIAFDSLGLDWEKHVREDRSLIGHTRKVLKGNPEKLMKKTGWQPTVDFQGMVKLLLARHKEFICE